MKKPTVALLKSNNRIQLRWTYKKERIYLSLGLSWNDDNLITANYVKALIEYDIQQDAYDPTLKKYTDTIKTDKGRKVRETANKRSQESLKIDEFFSLYRESKKPYLSETTYNTEYRHVLNRLKEYVKEVAPDDLTSNIAAVRLKQWLLQNYALITTKKTLGLVRSMFFWAIENQYISTQINPYETLRLPTRGTRGEHGSTSQRTRMAYTPKERDCIIEYFSSATEPEIYWYSHYVEVLFFTGCRISEAIALNTDDLNLDCHDKDKYPYGYICFNKSYSPIKENGKKIGLKANKTNTTRFFPLNQRLSFLLAQYLSIRYSKMSYQGNILFPYHLNKDRICLFYFSRNIWKPVISKLYKEKKLRYVLPPYNCRHTFISQCLSLGIDSATVAKWVGNSKAVIRDHYHDALETSLPPD